MPTVRLVTAGMIAAIGLAACGADAEDGADADAPAETSAQETSPADPVSGDAILIETRITDARSHTGEVVDGSVLAESAFCSGGETNGSSAGAVITATFSCPDGTLTVEYSPRQPSLVQSARWEVVDGTGSFAGLHGGGWMVAAFDGDDPDVGREVFTGTVSTS
jgi:hypothetical protein